MRKLEGLVKGGMTLEHGLVHWLVTCPTSEAGRYLLKARLSVQHLYIHIIKVRVTQYSMNHFSLAFRLQRPGVPAQWGHACTPVTVVPAPLPQVERDESTLLSRACFFQTHQIYVVITAPEGGRTRCRQNMAARSSPSSSPSHRVAVRFETPRSIAAADALALLDPSPVRPRARRRRPPRRRSRQAKDAWPPRPQGR